MIRKINTKSGEAKWEARLRESGRGSKYQSRRFDRKIDAERFIDQLKYDREQARNNPFATTKLQDRHFKEEAELWLADARLSHSPSHLKRMEGFFAEFLPLHGHLTMDKFTPEFFSRFQQQEKLKGLENSTIDKKCTMIQTVLNFAVNQRRIPFSPTLKLRKLSRTQNEMLFWNQDEALGFLSFANEYHAPDSESRWVYVAYLTALNTGLRAGEIWGLQPQDISADGKAIHVRRQWNRVSHSYTPTKSKKGRLVPCQAHLADELRKLIAKRRTKPDQPIFAGEEGRPSITTRSRTEGSKWT